MKNVATVAVVPEKPRLLRGLTNAFADALRSPLPIATVGRVVEAYGTLIKASGVQARIGELCILRHASEQTSGGSGELRAEVVGVSGDFTLLTPLGDLSGLTTGTPVVPTGQSQVVHVGDGLLGRVIDATGQPMDGRPLPSGLVRRPLFASPPNPLTRQGIHKPIETGVRAIDSLLTCAEGQRIGIFASAGGGKSTLLGMLARGCQVDVVVVALVGERGREVSEFIEDNLGEQGRKRAIIVVATADRPSLERARAAMLATSIAEHFRDEGKRVLLIVDSVTRHARALRDIGLAVGEPPTRRGFPPSVFSGLPVLFERAGNNDRGSITGFYSTLVEDEEQPDPIAEEVRSLLDGHIVLSRKLGNANHYPAIDILGSVSRVMNRVTTKEHQAIAGQARSSLSKYRDIELLIQLGEYKSGSDAEADKAIATRSQLLAHLQQNAHQLTTFDDAFSSLDTVVNSATF